VLRQDWRPLSAAGLPAVKLRVQSGGSCSAEAAGADEEAEDRGKEI